MEIEIIKWFQSNENAFLDTTFNILTQFGEDIFFVCMFLLLFWCVSYTSSFKFALFYMVSVVINSLLKLIVKRPRPWHADASITNKLHATGYSFPSGHSQSIAAISTFFTYNVYTKTKSNWMKISAIVISFVLCVLVAISRMYLGQHYLTDVICGLVIGVVLMLLLCLFEKVLIKLCSRIKLDYFLISISALILLFVGSVYIFNLELGSLSIKLFKYAGLLVGATIGYYFIKNEPNIVTSFNQRVFKLVLGLMVTFSLYFALKALLPQTSSIVFVTTLICSFVATFIYPICYNAIYNKIYKKDN